MEEKTLRIKQEQLDKLLKLAGDVITNHMEVELAEKTVRELKTHGVSVHEEIESSLKNLVVTGKKTSDELVKSLMEIRMVPVSNLFSRFPGMVREISRNQGKKVDFILEGEDTLVDKGISEKMADPLIHMLRNSADHGIEPYEDRLNNGKPEMGTIVLGARSEEDFIMFYIRDDGKGLNFEAILKKAITMNVIKEEDVSRMSREEMAKLIFHPGLSTAKQVTDISGRGVGMDVVKKNMDELKADIRIDSEPGKGTLIEVKIPNFRLVNIVDAIIVVSDDKYYGVPIKDIYHILSIPVKDLHFYNSRPFTTINGETLSLYTVYELLEDVYQTEWDFGDKTSLNVIVMEHTGFQLGMILDQLMGVQKLVIKRAQGVSERIKETMGIAGIGRGKMANVVNAEYILLKHRTKKTLDQTGSAPEEAGQETPAEAAAEIPEETSETASTPEAPAERRKLSEVLGGDTNVEMMGDILTDIEEHVMHINQDIRVIETEPSKELFGKLFRAVHSCKGAFGALKLDKLVKVTNEGEDLLSLLRDEKIQVNETIVDLLFRLTSIIESALNELKNDIYPEIAAEDLTNEIVEYKETVAPKEQPGAAENMHVAKDTAFDFHFLEVLNLQNAMASGKNLFEVFIRVNKDVVMLPVRVVILFTDLYHQGEIIASIPSLRSLERFEEYEAFKFIYNTEMNAEELAAKIKEEELTDTVDVIPYE